MAGKGLPRGPLWPPLFLSNISIITYVMASFFLTAVVSSSSETDILLQFKSTLSFHGGDDPLRTWTPGSAPCTGNSSNWGVGVLCYKGYVWGLQLEGKGLTGTLRLEPLVALPGLRTLSFMRNNLTGPLPDIAKLGVLKNVYLSDNQFRGEIPDDVFTRMRSLKKVYLSRNDFSGKIPSSLKGLQKLLRVRLDGNQFQGVIPDLPQPALQLFNVSYNKLQGQIPHHFRKMPPSSFQGNEELCGAPLDVECEILSPSALPTPKRKPSTLLLLIVIIVISLLALLALACVVFVILRRRRRRRQRQNCREGQQDTAACKDGNLAEADKLERGAGNGGSGKVKAGKEVGDGHLRLAFVRESRERFELQDLLKASAEVLGSGDFGSSYKAALLNGPSVVVKRFKEMNGVGREDFVEHMRRLGRLSHPNLLPLVAYYYRKEEKLLITDYIPNGSLAHMLHGNHGSNLPPLEWATRLRIIKGVARGLAYLYEELPVLTLPHGHLKSSNVLVDDNYDPLLTDYALEPVMNQSHASQVMVAYKTPEVTQTGRPSKKSDVWSLGILILEVLTGQFPTTYLQKGKGGMDLAAWVSSVVKEEWTAREVFDSEMKVTKNGEAQMLKLLQIGLGCCQVEVGKRWELKDALEKIEELKELRESDDDNDDDDDDNSSFVSETAMYSSLDDVSFAAAK